MALTKPDTRARLTRRRFVQCGIGGAVGLGIYSTVVARHWLETTRHDVHLAELPAAFDGLRIAQLSDIHLDEFTEPIFLQHAIETINHLKPDVVLLTGDFISYGLTSKHFAIGAAWQCASMLTQLKCSEVYAVLGNHDFFVGPNKVTEALTANKIKTLNNACLALERGGDRIWITGVEDPLMGNPDPEKAIPASIRNVPGQPVILMCHAPDYADDLIAHPAGNAVDMMLSGHTHGGQVRLPLVGALQLPDMGKKYVDGFFQIGPVQLYVNRGLGTIGVPFRLNCSPEIAVFTLRGA